jgi:hypothetical protein
MLCKVALVRRSEDRHEETLIAVVTLEQDSKHIQHLNSIPAEGRHHLQTMYQYLIEQQVWCLSCVEPVV